LQNYNIRIFLT